MARILEILFSRVLPGAFNFAVIVLIGRSLNSVDYGQFSLVLANISLLVSLLVGPIEQSIVPMHAKYSLNERGHEFEQKLLGACLLVVGASFVVGVFLFFLLHNVFVWIFIFASSALMAVFSAVLRARLQFWYYGAAALAKAISALILIAIFLDNKSHASAALSVYAVSIAIGAFASWGMTGFPLPQFANRAFLRETIPVGTGLTISTMAEAVIFVGTRYVISFFGNPAFLGVFSFALDLAQRSVGIVINIASFAIIPKAYVISVKNNDKIFRKMLLKSAIWAFLFSLVVLTTIVCLDYSGLTSAYLGENYDVAAFVSISIAVIINRLKKLAIDPVLVSIGVVKFIACAYLIFGPLFLLFIAMSLWLDKELFVLILYPVSYFVISIYTYMSLRFSKK